MKKETDEKGRELILYYSLGGTTKRYAEARAEETGAEICQILEQKPRTLLTAFVPGCIQSGKLAATPIQPLGRDLDEYDVFTLAAPVWAGHQAPAINAVIARFPAGKRVRVVMISGGGSAKTEPIKKLIEERGCQVTDILQIAAKNVP